ncbi:MAG TPA: UDP-N-acetylmuramate dehydrogenase [Edaphocola sp.]|nr:UDP-N-acetylmuramate dehydrogenase [Edaphocola sp.]
MIEIEKNISLLPYNTFGMARNASAMSLITHEDQLAELPGHEEYQQGILVLGGGSNFLFTTDVREWVIRNNIKGKRIIDEDKDFVWVEAGGGEVWHNFVLYTVQSGFGGLENLSLIPGKVGAAPVQNIGAYGAEIKDTLFRVKAWDLQQKCFRIFSNIDCRLGYRDSIFKNQYKGRFMITSVIFQLRKKPVFNIEYGGIRKELEVMGLKELSLKAVSDAVTRIRRSKLPDPAVVGNAGSFFKNPVISSDRFGRLESRFPEIPFYETGAGQYKIPAAWLIEQCGWKGFRDGNIGVHPRQALVLVNYGGGNGKSIYDLSQKIILSVSEKFGILLEREVQVYG